VSSQPVVLITGASAGIGAALARAWASRGARLVLCARKEPQLRALADELERDGAQVLALTADVTHAQDRERLVKQSLGRFGSIDVLVNNAGRGMHTTVEDAPLDDLAALYGLNVIAPVALTQLALPALRKSRGTVVMMSSVAGLVCMPKLGGYASSKFALEAISSALRAEVSKDGVKVLVVRPGPVNTEFRANAFRYDDGSTYQPRGDKAQTAEDVAERTIKAVERGAHELDTSLMVRGAGVLARVAPGLLRVAQRLVARR
jgi:short-subunit dehydrogenase